MLEPFLQCVIILGCPFIFKSDVQNALGCSVWIVEICQTTALKIGLSTRWPRFTAGGLLHIHSRRVFSGDSRFPQRNPPVSCLPRFWHFPGICDQNLLLSVAPAQDSGYMCPSPLHLPNVVAISQRLSPPLTFLSLITYPFLSLCCHISGIWGGRGGKCMYLLLHI